MQDSRFQIQVKILLLFFVFNLASGIWHLESLAVQDLPQVTEIKATEIEDQTHSRVIVREHPKTGRPYVSIVSSEAPVPEDPFTHQRNRYSRPDYRMLDPKAKKGDYHYDGPYNDLTKVYIFGITLMTLGVVGGTVGMALVPASTAAAGAASSGGGAAYLVGAGALATGGGVAVGEMTRTKPGDDNFIHEGESRTLEASDNIVEGKEQGGSKA